MWAWWAAMGKADPNFEYKRPISFYGVAQDENGNPISGAMVGFTIQEMGDDQVIELKSDSQGRFQLENQNGKYLTVGISVPNYDSIQKTYNYAAFFDDSFIVPDPNNPVVFTLRKLTPAEMPSHPRPLQ